MRGAGSCHAPGVMPMQREHSFPGTAAMRAGTLLKLAAVQLCKWAETTPQYLLLRLKVILKPESLTVYKKEATY